MARVVGPGPCCEFTFATERGHQWHPSKYLPRVRPSSTTCTTHRHAAPLAATPVKPSIAVSPVPPKAFPNSQQLAVAQAAIAIPWPQEVLHMSKRLPVRKSLAQSINQPNTNGRRTKVKAKTSKDPDAKLLEEA